MNFFIFFEVVNLDPRSGPEFVRSLALSCPTPGLCRGTSPPMEGGSSGRGRYGDERTRRRRSRGGNDDEREEEGPSTSDDRRRPPPPLTSSPALDFLSPSFDAALALSTRGLLPPDPRAPVLDNVSSCRRLLPAGAEGTFADADAGRPFSGAAAAALAKKPPRPLTTAAAATRQGGRRVPALDAIAEASLGGSTTASGGPLTLLKRAYDSKSKIKVLTRHARGVRGSAVGTLCGFDVFMNLILRDVVEEYTVRVPVTRERPAKAAGAAAAAEGGGGGAEKGEKDCDGEKKKEQALPPPPEKRRLRHCYRLEPRTRSLRLVFLRGDSVVLVSRCGSG